MAIILIAILLVGCAIAMIAARASAVTDNVSVSGNISSNVTFSSEQYTGFITAMNDNTEAVDGLTSAVRYVGSMGILFIPLAFFTILTWKVENDWGKPVLALLTAGISLMLGYYAADIIDGYYVTTGYGLVIAVALIIYAMLCVAWAWSMMTEGLRGRL